MTSFDVNIPANTTATVHVPAARGQVVRERGLPIAEAVGVKVLRTEADRVVVEVGSGSYQFMLLLNERETGGNRQARQEGLKIEC